MIDAKNKGENIIIKADRVTVKGFKLINSGRDEVLSIAAIHIYNSSYSVIEDNIQSEAAVTTPAEIFITTDDNEINSNGKEFKKLVFARDIFKSPYEKKEAAQEIKDIDNQMKEEKEEVPPPKISGVFLSRAVGKTFLTADGKIVGENETINGYKVLKILKEEVLFEKSNGKIIKVNIWEE